MAEFCSLVSFSAKKIVFAVHVRKQILHSSQFYDMGKTSWKFRQNPSASLGILTKFPRGFAHVIKLRLV